LSARDGLLLGVLSNSSPEHDPFIPSFEKHFDVLRFSHRTGLRKPWPEAYAATAEALDLAPAEVVFIDDRIRNIEPASAIGMRALHFTGASELQAQLSELGLHSGSDAER
jgi:HAD superfamily hydrolase (TIGR01509 family)